MDTQISFPTLGEVAKELFELSGFLAQKHKTSSVIATDEQKKNIQKKLQRLSKEDGELEENLHELLVLWTELLHERIEDPEVVNAICFTVKDAFLVYNEVVKDEGTYLNKSGSSKWLIESILPSRITTSIHKWMITFGIRYKELSFPKEPFWWLPSQLNDETVWPLKHAFDWLYVVCKTNKTNFHYPNYKLEDDPKRKQDLENAIGWSKGKHLPALSNLLKAINDGLDQRNDVSPKNKGSINIIFFLARLSTAIFMKIEENYGKHVLSDALDRSKTYYNLIEKEFRPFNNFIHNEVIRLKEHGFNPDNPQVICHFYKLQSEFSNHWGKKIEESQRYVPLNQLDSKPKQLERVQNNKDILGDFLAYKLTHLLSLDSHVDLLPHMFFESYCEGEKILKESRFQVLNQSRINSYRALIHSHHLEPYLKWQLLWIDAHINIHQGKKKDALACYEKSFELAKYCAGQRQYTLVNEYLLFSAKNSKWKQFKKAYAWAEYLNIPIRIIRNFEGVTAKEAFNLFKSVNIDFI